MSGVEINIPRVVEAIEGRLRERLEDIGRISVAKAKQHAPVKTGALRDSIAYDVDADDLSVRFGSPLLYARFVEFGHDHETYTVPPRSFLRRTADDLADDYARIAAR